MPQNNASASSTRLSADIGREIDQARSHGSLQRIQIPPCPALLLRLQVAMKDTEPDLNEVARIASSDVAMSATLMRFANSPANSTGHAVQTVGQAMNRLGLKQTASVLTGFLVQNAIPVNNRHLDRFWERSAQRASLLSFIARQLPGLSPDLAHTYGLFNHVGLPVLLQSVKGYAGTLVEGTARVDRSMVATENANHHTDHAVVGALVARVWRLAPEVMAAIRLHHELDSLGEHSTEPEAHTLVAAGVVADHLLRVRDGLKPDRDWADHGVAALKWLHVTEEEVATWEEEYSGLPVH